MITCILLAWNARSSREGWVFRPSTLTAAPLTITDMVTFVLPDNTEKNPLVVTETLRDAVSEAYHVNWWRYRTATLKDERDKDAGMKLSRSRRLTTSIQYTNKYIYIHVYWTFVLARRPMGSVAHFEQLDEACSECQTVM